MIAKRIFDQYAATQEDSRRPHLGASVVGQPCARAIWYSFRWVKQIKHSGRLLRIFETGKREEPRVYANLAAIGVVVENTQAGFATLGGHFAGSCDGIINGDTLLEIKTHNSKSFNKLEKDGLPATHTAQMQIYMHMLKLKKGLYFAVNKETDEIFTADIIADEKWALRLLEKAHAIIYTDAPPQKISGDPAFFICKMCNYREVCKGDIKPERNCRTCAHSTVAVGWECTKLDDAIPDAIQRVGCSQHRYLPPLIGGVDDVQGDDIIYKNGWMDCGSLVTWNDGLGILTTTKG